MLKFCTALVALPLLLLAPQATALLTMPVPHPMPVRVPIQDKAQVYGRALRLLPTNNIESAQLHERLGSLRATRNEYEKAKKEWAEALAIYTRIHGASSPSIAVILNHLGWVNAKLGLVSQARDCYVKALKVQEKTGAPEFVREATRSSLMELK